MKRTDVTAARLRPAATAATTAAAAAAPRVSPALSSCQFALNIHRSDC